MEKNQEAIERLLSESLNLKDKTDKNSVYMEIADKLMDKSKQENAKAVAAILKIEEKTGKEPEFEDPSGLGIKRCLGQDIRDGIINPTEDSKQIYQENAQMSLPGTRDLSDQEIALRDIEIGFKESGYQSGKKPTSQEDMAIEILGGQSQEGKLNPAPFGESEAQMSFGPSKVLKGLLTGDMDELRNGLKETLKVGAIDDLRENLHTLAPGMKVMDKFLETLDNPGEKLKDGVTDFSDIMSGRKSSPINPTTLSDIRDSLVDVNQKGNLLANEIVDSFKTGKMGKEMQGLIDISKTGSLEDVEKHVEGMFDKLSNKIDKKSEEEPGEKKESSKPPEQSHWSEVLAGRIAGAATYKAGRSKGLSGKNAGEMGAVAESEATDIAKTTKDNEASRDKSVDMAKGAKNALAKTAASIADKVPAPPGLGKAISIGIIIVDKATDFMMDLINNKGGLESLNKAGGSLEKLDNTPGGIEVFQSQMTKTKGGIVKKLIPAKEDVLSTAMKGAVDGIGSWGKEQVKGKRGQTGPEHKQLDQPS